MTPGMRRWLGTAAVLLAGLTVGGIIMLSAVWAEEAAAEARAVEVSHVLADSIRTELEAITAPADALHAQIVAKDGKPDPADLGVFARQLLDLSSSRRSASSFGDPQLGTLKQRRLAKGAGRDRRQSSLVLSPALMYDIDLGACDGIAKPIKHRGRSWGRRPTVSSPPEAYAGCAAVLIYKNTIAYS